MFCQPRQEGLRESCNSRRAVALWLQSARQLYRRSRVHRQYFAISRLTNSNGFSMLLHEAIAGVRVVVDAVRRVRDEFAAALNEGGKAPQPRITPSTTERRAQTLELSRSAAPTDPARLHMNRGRSGRTGNPSLRIAADARDRLRSLSDPRRSPE